MMHGTGAVPVVQEDIVYHQDKGRDLRLDLFSPSPERSLHTAVVQVHGGRWRVGTRKSLRAHAERLCDRGFTCVAVEYRSVVEAPWPNNLYDVKAAIRWVRVHAEQLEVDPGKIALQGFSSGGHLALVAAGTAGHASLDGGGQLDVSSAVGAVAVAYPSVSFRLASSGDRDRLYPDIDADGDIPSWLLLGDSATAEDVQAASALTYLTAAYPATLLGHGTGDTVIPVESTLRVYRRLAALDVDCDLHLFGRQDHGFDAGPSLGDVFDREVTLFLRRTLAEPKVIEAETPTFADILAQVEDSEAMVAAVAEA